MMSKQWCLIFVVFNWMPFKALSQNTRLELISTPDIIERHGYPSETHDVTTEDGYILEVHRIPYGRDGPTTLSRPPVLMMHGLTGASSNFVALGPKDSIAYNLVDAGFDVWMGNARGTKDSRKHISLDPDGEKDRFKFWDFTWEEIGFYDVAAITDYIRGNTQNKKIHYIGHSQGGTVFYVLNTLRPEYNEKFASAQLLAPSANLGKHPDSGSTGAIFTDRLYQAAVERGFLEIGWNLLGFLINNNEQFLDSDIWTIMLTEIYEKSLKSILLAPSFFGGAAVKQFAHYGQNTRFQNFQRWDFGIIKNLQVYGTIRPPTYNMPKLIVNTTLHYAVADRLVGYKDVLEMERLLPNAISRKVPDENFTHAGFMFRRTVKELVNDYIVEQLKIAENFQ